VAKADSLRDSGFYAKAADAYGSALQLDPKDLGIAKQLGNMLKDSGRLDEAERQYNEVLREDRSDGDTFLQLGHLNKIRGKISVALDYYRKAAEADKPAPPAAGELKQLGQVAEVDENSKSAVVDNGGLMQKLQDFAKGKSNKDELDGLAAAVQALRDEIQELRTHISPELGPLNELVAHKRSIVGEVERKWNMFLPFMLNVNSAIVSLAERVQTLETQMQQQFVDEDHAPIRGNRSSHA
jgi:tetratricopeptide (TPR) repeat protein